MENNGWVKLHRRITQWEWYKDGNTFRLFLHLLVSANHEARQWRGVTVERGQVVVGRAALAFALNLSEQSVRTALCHLQKTQEIAIEPTNKYSLITLKNYEEYQGRAGEANQQNNQQATGGDSQQANQQSTTNKNVKNTKKVKKAPAAARANSLEEIAEFCQELGLYRIDAEHLWDHWMACGWKNNGKPVLDWKRTIRNWQRLGYLLSQKNPSHPDVLKEQAERSKTPDLAAPEPAGWRGAREELLRDEDIAQSAKTKLRDAKHWSEVDQSLQPLVLRVIEERKQSNG